MDDARIPIDLSDLDRRTEERAEEIQSVLEHIKPAQCELLGEETVRAISRGAVFESVDGGRHLNFMEMIAILSGLATICQISFIAIGGLRKLLKANNDETITAAKKVILEKVSTNPELSDLRGLIAHDPLILDKILAKVLADSNKAQD